MKSLATSTRLIEAVGAPLSRCKSINGLDAAETSSIILIRQAALNELTLAALVAGITSSLFQMSAPSNERTGAGRIDVDVNLGAGCTH